MVSAKDSCRQRTVGRNASVKSKETSDTARRATDQVELLILLDEGRNQLHNGFGLRQKFGPVPQHTKVRQSVNYSAPAAESTDLHVPGIPSLQESSNCCQRHLCQIGIAILAANLAQISKVEGDP